jgi:dihydrolipoamide dehydrogenase
MGKYQARACGDLVGARATGRPVDERAMTPWATGLGPPQVIFTDPEVSSAGLTAEQARARDIRTRVLDIPMDSAAGPGLQAEGYQGQARIVVDEDHGVLVGATFVGQDVADLIHPATVAIVGKVPLSTLWHAVPSYPAMSEIWLRLLEKYGL